MDQNDYFKIFRSSVDVRGKHVLEVGGSVPPSVVADARVASWTSINISAKYGSGESRPDWYASVIMNATEMTFPDNHFDAVFSSNCFEHVSDPALAFKEICRVLKPGGIFFTIFGPIWSGPIGHHTWVWHDGKPLTFNDGVIAPWGHLTWQRSALKFNLAEQYSAKTADEIIRYIYDSNDINRRPDSYYEAAISWLRFSPIIKYRIKTKADLDLETAVALMHQHPTANDFRTTGLFWVMAKHRRTLRQVIHAYFGAAAALAGIALAKVWK